MATFRFGKLGLLMLMLLWGSGHGQSWFPIGAVVDGVVGVVRVVRLLPVVGPYIREAWPFGQDDELEETRETFIQGMATSEREEEEKEKQKALSDQEAFDSTDHFFKVCAQIKLKVNMEEFPKVVANTAKMCNFPESVEAQMLDIAYGNGGGSTNEFKDKIIDEKTVTGYYFSFFKIMALRGPEGYISYGFAYAKTEMEMPNKDSEGNDPGKRAMQDQAVFREAKRKAFEFWKIQLKEQVAEHGARTNVPAIASGSRETDGGTTCADSPCKLGGDEDAFCEDCGGTCAVSCTCGEGYLYDEASATCMRMTVK